MNSTKNKYIKLGIGLLVIVALIFVYKVFNPYHSTLFPKCPFYVWTDLKCPGCGSQRAIHYLLNLDFKGAFKENQLLVFSIPYMILGLMVEYLLPETASTDKLRHFFFGTTAIWIAFTLIILFTIIRNLI